MSKVKNILKPKKILARKIIKHDKTQIQKAVEEIKSGITYREVALKYNIPKSTLRDKVIGKYEENKIRGPQTIFTKEHEDLIENWIIELGQKGYPVTRNQLSDSVALLAKNLGINNKFVNGRPGRRWIELFLKRHPNISSRISQNITHSRSKINENQIRNWFGRVSDYLKSSENSNILNNPSRIFNCDESAFFLSPKEKRVLAKKGSKHVYNRIGNDEKDCLTVLVNANAEGTLAPPMVIYSYKRIPYSIISKLPKGWGIGATDSGWMTAESFYEYITNVFHPWLKKKEIELPVILFVDGHVSHVSLSVAEFCKENSIILIALLPNATHLLQPMDVSVFSPLKRQWINFVHDWRVKNNYERLKREDFAPLLKECLDNSLKTNTVPNGFRKTGLYPFNPDEIEYSKLVSSTELSENSEKSRKVDTVSSSNCDINLFLSTFESRIGESKLELFHSSGENWKGPVEDKSLFDFWKNIHSDIARKEIAEKELHEPSSSNIQLSNITFDENWFSDSK